MHRDESCRWARDFGIWRSVPLFHETQAALPSPVCLCALRKKNPEQAEDLIGRENTNKHDRKYSMRNSMPIFKSKEHSKDFASQKGQSFSATHQKMFRSCSSVQVTGKCQYRPQNANNSLLTGRKPGRDRNDSACEVWGQDNARSTFCPSDYNDPRGLSACHNRQQRFAFCRGHGLVSWRCTTEEVQMQHMGASSGSIFIPFHVLCQTTWWYTSSFSEGFLFQLCCSLFTHSEAVNVFFSEN